MLTSPSSAPQDGRVSAPQEIGRKEPYQVTSLTVVCSLKLKRVYKVREEEFFGFSVTIWGGRVKSEPAPCEGLKVRQRAAPPPPSLPAAETKTYFNHIIINSHMKKKKPLTQRESSTGDAPPETDMSQISTRRQNTLQIKRWAPDACGSY